MYPCEFLNNLLSTRFTTYYAPLEGLINAFSFPKINEKIRNEKELWLQTGHGFIAHSDVCTGM